jgi:hypothetical protein
LPRELEFGTRVVIVEFDAARNLGDVVMETKLFLGTLLILDDERIVQTVVIDVLPLLVELWPDT